MRRWAVLLAGLLIWALHFFALYLIAEFAGDGIAARLAVGLISLTCLAGAILLLVRSRRAAPEAEFDHWRRSFMQTGLILSLCAILWQALPALLAR